MLWGTALNYTELSRQTQVPYDCHRPIYGKKKCGRVETPPLPPALVVSSSTEQTACRRGKWGVSLKNCHCCTFMVSLHTNMLNLRRIFVCWVMWRHCTSGIHQLFTCWQQFFYGMACSPNASDLCHQRSFLDPGVNGHLVGQWLSVCLNSFQRRRDNSGCLLPRELSCYWNEQVTRGNLHSAQIHTVGCHAIESLYYCYYYSSRGSQEAKSTRAGVSVQISLHLVHVMNVALLESDTWAHYVICAFWKTLKWPHHHNNGLRGHAVSISVIMAFTKRQLQSGKKQQQ